MADERRREPRLRGCVAVVVGVGTSAGRAAARRFAAEGADVVAVDRDADAAGATVAEDRVTAAGAPGARAAAFVGDPDRPEDAEALIELVDELFARRAESSASA